MAAETCARRPRVGAASGDVDAVVGVVEGRVVDKRVGEGRGPMRGDGLGRLRPVAVQRRVDGVTPVASVEGRVRPCVLRVTTHDVVLLVQVVVDAGVLLAPEKTGWKR